MFYCTTFSKNILITLRNISLNNVHACDAIICCYNRLQCNTYNIYCVKVLYDCIVKQALADNLMEHIGIPTNYKQMLKAEIGNILGALTFALSVITINSSLIFTNDKIPLRSKMLSAFIMGYPVLVTFIADATFMNIVRKVLSELKQNFPTIQTFIHIFLKCTLKKCNTIYIMFKTAAVLNIGL